MNARALTLFAASYSIFALLPCVPGAPSLPDPSRITNGADAVNAAEQGYEAGQEANNTRKELEEAATRCKSLDVSNVPYEEETSFGGAMAVRLAQKGLLVDIDKSGALDGLRNADGYAYPKTDKNKGLEVLNVIGRNLGALSDRAMVDWKFAVLDDDKTVNAVSAPGGYVFVTKALMAKVENEDQLAGVLAHEVGHIVLRHALHAYTRTKVTACEASYGTGMGAQYAKQRAMEAAYEASGGTPQFARDAFGAALQTGDAYLDLDNPNNLPILSMLTEQVVGFIVNTGFSKEDELEADRVAADLLGRAGYSVEEYQKFLGNLPSSSSVFAHHPTGAERVKAILTWRASRKEAKSAEYDPFAPPDSKRAPVALAPELNALR